MSRSNEWDPKSNVRSFASAKPQPESQALQKIEAYWTQLRGGRVVPSRSEIDPRALEGVLGNAFILERISPNLARFRIAGSHMAEFTGLELRQMPISVLFNVDSRPVLAEALEAAFDEPAMVKMDLRSPGGFSQETLQGQMILLPLRSDAGDVTRVLGGIAMTGNFGRKPRRLEILHQERQTLTGYAGDKRRPTPVPDKILPRTSTSARPDVVKKKPRVISSKPLPTAPQNDAPESRTHLKLVVSND